MFLSKLQILGFKSFPQKTELYFDRGITAIVGPNGCGKTNLLDAIRWVLGEQRTSLLRSSKMEEVIFNGTKDMKPLGMAEVTLIIQNDQRILPTDYDQVTVTRRLFRSGESEYLLNKAPCRLKDITELFLDTGVGVHAYSVMQPEMVEAILSDKAEERRFLFEEAAGITKYKFRKKEAERKLQQTENDLLRLGDILSEVEKQTNSLRRQKGKAERFKKLAEQIKELEIKLSHNQFLILKEKERALDERLKASTDMAQKTISDLSKEESASEELKLKLLEIEKEQTTLKKRISQLSEKSFQIEREISVNRERKANMEKMIEKDDQDLKDLKDRLCSIKAQRKEKDEELSRLAEETDTKRKVCEAEEKTLLVNDEQLQQMKERLEKLSDGLEKLNDRLIKQRSEKKNIETQVNELKQRNAIFTEERRSVQQTTDEISEKLKRLSSLDEERRRVLKSKIEETQLLQKKIGQIQSRLTQLGSEQIRKSSLLEGESAKLKMLSEISLHYEGYGEGVKSVLSARDNLPGIIDTVANLVTTKAQYLKAIECALGEFLQFIVCQNEESALKAIQYLRKQNAGRATFLPLDKIGVIKMGSPGIELKSYPGVIGWVVDLVECKPEFRKMVNLALANTILVTSLDEALKLSAQLEPGFRIVTLEGEIIRTEGGISGGSPQKISLLGREDQIQKLKEQIFNLTQQLDQIETEKKENEERKDKLARFLSGISAETEECNQSIQKFEIELKTLEFEKGNLKRRESELERLIEEIGKKTLQLNQTMESLDKDTGRLEDQKERLSAQIDEEERKVKKTETFHTDTFKKVNQLRIELVSLESKEEQVKSELTRFTELIGEIEKAQMAKERELEECTQEIKEIAQVIAEKEEELKQTFQEMEKEKTKLNSKVEEQIRLQESLNLKEKNLKISRQLKEKASDQLHQLRMEKVELSSQLTNIKDRIWEEYQTDLEKLKPSAAQEMQDLETLKGELNRKKEKLQSIGTVNLLALEEYRSAKNRLDFLQNQIKDLTEAKRTLTSTIARINHTAQTLFSQTFDQIKLNFQKVFEELFDGGETDLRLAESADPMESPIQISARPYGKRLLNISQLSGGEKALTAIALLFAIYLVKPSPFCILDEVDAPLDDANVVRFLKLIKNFSSNTQFIIITHNKLTMEAADILYGVTMEQPGVSKIVSVKFDKHEVVTTKEG